MVSIRINCPSILVSKYTFLFNLLIHQDCLDQPHVLSLLMNRIFSLIHVNQVYHKRHLLAE